MRATGWILAYLGLIAFPVAILLCGTVPRGGGFAWDFAMALGFGGLAMLGLQSALTARFRRATAPFGIDIIYYFHRWAAVTATAIVLLHYLILRIGYPAALGPVNPLAAAWPMTAGRLALGLFVVLVVTSLARRALHLEYDRWRIAHATMAVLAVLLAMAHIWGVGHYTAAWGKGALWLTYSALWVFVVGYVRGLRPAALRRAPYRVTKVRPERGRAWTVTVRPEGHAGLAFAPGQFAWLTLRASPFAAREHPFSFSGSAADPGALQFTIKELGDFTRTIGDVRAGEVAFVDGPHGSFTCDRVPRAPGFVFIAGGIGIAPIMSMLRSLAERGDRRPLRLLYGSRRWADVTFREEIEALRDRLSLEVVHVLQEPPADWRGQVGVLSEDVVRAALPPLPAETEFFLCGPKAMSAAVQRTLRRRGVSLRRMHCELFDMA